MSIPSENNLLIYTADDGSIQVETIIKDETVRLSQDQMAILFGKAKSTINEHIKNIYKEGELVETETLHKFGNSEFQQKATNYYNLDVIISVGYRVRSPQGTQFRQRATKRIHEYIIKGFALDDTRLSQGGNKARYFKELLQRIRDIRASERNFYQQVTDIYATSIDYDKNDGTTKQFFATVQNKMHYAVHGHTAAEIVHTRVDSEKEMIGLTSFKGNYITQKDTTIAKNYLTEQEISQLNLIVSLYLDFAELQASNQKAMTMQGRIQKLDEFLMTAEKGILDNAGSISHQQAVDKATEEFQKYKEKEMLGYTSDFDLFMEETKQLPKK